MMKFTCQPPSARANKISQGPNILNYRYIQQFGIRVSNDMAIIRARVLPAPKLQYHFTSRKATFVPKNGSWNMLNKKVATGATLGSWACVSFAENIQQGSVHHFLRELITTCQDTGMNIPNRNPPIVMGNSQGNIEQTLRQAWVKAGNMSKSAPQLIVCVLPNTGVQLYAEIKRVSDTIIGVATQCVQSKHIFSAKKQYRANVCLKINVKLGGMNSFIEPSLIPFISQLPAILMGASVSHPSPGSDANRPSVAALCASMDAKAARYAASIRIQTGRQVIITDLAAMVKELLKTFYQTCGRKPERILFYRDGVSENQFEQVLEGEINAVKSTHIYLFIYLNHFIMVEMFQTHTLFTIL